MRTVAWQRILGTNPYLTRKIKYGIKVIPSLPCTKRVILPVISQTEADKEFAQEDIRKGLQGQIYEKITGNYAQEKVEGGLIVSSSFVVWQGDKKGRDFS